MVQEDARAAVRFLHKMAQDCGARLALERSLNIRERNFPKDWRIDVNRIVLGGRCITCKGMLQQPSRIRAWDCRVFPSNAPQTERQAATDSHSLFQPNDPIPQPRHCLVKGLVESLRKHGSGQVKVIGLG